MADVRDLLFFVVKIVGGKGVCILGSSKFLVTGMQLEPSRKIGTNKNEDPFEYSRRMTDRGMYAKFSAFRHGLR
jgi:hypothetical protein